MIQASDGWAYQILSTQPDGSAYVRFARRRIVNGHYEDSTFFCTMSKDDMQRALDYRKASEDEK